MMGSDQFAMECPRCGKRVTVDRIDSDPPSAVRLTLVCDTCDDGDFHTPEHYDASGRWVHPTEHMA